MKRTRSRLIGCVLIILFCQAPTVSSGQTQDDGPVAQGEDSGARKRLAPPNPFPRTTRLDPNIFDLGSGWLNTDEPIKLKDLEGKIVVLDFWTYCCINCMHVLPDLKYLERKYAKELVVIGVHSAKFDNEKDEQQIQAAIERYEIDHPVVNDKNMLIWNQFGVRAWPTLALIDPEGRLVGIQPGEGNRILFDRIIGQMAKYHRWKGTLDEKPLVFQKQKREPNLTTLRYPGKILLDETQERLFIADSSHHRIVVCDLDGKFQYTIGSATQGFQDGSFAEAMFNRPQGMALQGDTLFVADTDNHSVRAVNLNSGNVTTLAGDGQQASFGASGGQLAKTRLNSPWDLAIQGERLYVAMAGNHQIWKHDLSTDTIEVYAGNGREDVINGSLKSSAFAQPSDLAISSDGERMYVVDSEGSAIRRIDLDTGFVSTSAGTCGLPRGQSLFAFGDVDGIGSDIRMQHPLAVAVVPGGLLVADSYNHKIRKLSLPLAKSSTWVGSGTAGSGLDPLQLAEPGDVTVSTDFAWVADTNNHRILKIDLATQSVSVLPIVIAEKSETEAASESESESNSPEEDPS